jgi:bacillithiol biosynthesis cysteine-adding enzyme BshC
MMNDLLEDSGMIFLDPNDRDLKQLLVPIFRRELEQTPRICQLVIDQSAELEKRYHAQVKPKPVNLFLLHQEGRYLLEPRGAGFALKGTRQHFSAQDLFQLLESDPQYFSPNVVLRPICQDTLLPTVTYVAGPAEVAYFAQIKPVFEHFGLPVPLLYPRASATLLEDKVKAVFERYGLGLPDFFQDVELIKRGVAAKLSALRLDEVFGGTRATLAETLQTLGEALRTIDPTLRDATDTAARKVEHQIQSLEQKAMAAQVRRNEAALRQIEKAAAHVFPRSNFQERELNVVHFLNRYGMEFLRWLRGELVIDRFRHQIISLT